MLNGNLLSLCADKALYVGELPATERHRHAAPVLLLGLSGRFALGLPDGRRELCRSALIDSGVDHVFDPRGERVALIYLEPDAPEVRRLRPWFAQQGPVLFDAAAPVLQRWHTEQRLLSFDLAALLGRRDLPPVAAADPRVLRGLRRLREAGDDMPDRDALAREARLSASRFNHLFSAEAGVSLRSYRVWAQVRRAMAAYRPDGSLTQAALEGAFADSAHFSRMFRQTFGMTPSSVLRPLRQVQWRD